MFKIIFEISFIPFILGSKFPKSIELAFNPFTLIKFLFIYNLSRSLTMKLSIHPFSFHDFTRLLYFQSSFPWHHRISPLPLIRRPIWPSKNPFLNLPIKPIPLKITLIWPNLLPKSIPHIIFPLPIIAHLIFMLAHLPIPFSLPLHKIPFIRILIIQLQAPRPMLSPHLLRSSVLRSIRIYHHPVNLIHRISNISELAIINSYLIFQASMHSFQ